jgi:HAMP domain-containing protein
MKSKSTSTKWLIVTLIATFVFAFSYFVSHSFYAEISAYHRWVSLTSSMFVALFVSILFLTFPSNERPKLTKYSFVFLFLFTIIASSLFIMGTLKHPIVFNFSAQNFDFDADDLSAKAGGAILINAISFIGFGIYNAIKRKASRYAILLIFLSYIFIMVIPAILNVLTRMGAMERDLYISALTNMSIFGHFILIVTYINNTEDPSTFMTKILSITMALFLVIMELLTHNSLKNSGNLYDDLRINEAFLHLKGMKSSNVKYEYHFDDDSILSPYFIEAKNTSIIETLREKESNPSELISVLENMDSMQYPYFEGYKRYLYNSILEDGDRISVSEKLMDIKQTIIYKRNAIRKIPASDFRLKLLEFLAKQKGSFLSFQDVLKEFLNHTPLENEALKEEVLKYLEPGFPKEKSRLREDNLKNHFVSYLLPDPNSGKMVEIGFAYVSYRAFLHKSAEPIAIILLCVTLVVLLGFRFFFYKSMVQPLEHLLAGVDKVNAGDLDVQVAPGVADEIGYLTTSFNGMVSSIRDAQFALKEYANQLEEKVVERTKELQVTIGKIQELKTQQDGDYFLTSLLLRPLNQNKALSDKVEIEFFSSQKKKFQFKDWKEEIGGDVCMANTIELKGRKYTVYVNADAMGKSLQGAGGALVLGSVFESIINRNRIAKNTRDVFPERWIKDAFLELHHVFETFDGSMLVSLVLGLIEDESGLLYSLNAEHPWTILLRDEKASFIDHENTYRKLGTLGADGSIKIFTAQLFPGDILISGSDGRDDVIIQTSEGKGNMNEDETLILGHVEKTNGDLEGIYAEILNLGKPIDDLTLLKVTYKKSGATSHLLSMPEDIEICKEAKALIRSGAQLDGISLLESAIEHGKSSPLLLKTLFYAYVQANQFDQAGKIALEVAHVNSGNTELLFQTSYILKKTGDYPSASDLGERVKLRNPNHVRNLINLADANFFGGNPERAKTLIDKVLEIEPNNAYAIKRKSVFEKRVS